MRPIFPALLMFAVCAQPGQASELRAFEDAAIRAVHFVDDREGWAVGDEGVIWHTIDGGKSWERQSTGVRASLRGVHFSTPFVGWAVGREELPGGTSAGVVLYTRDGGLAWKQILLNSLPGLHVVRFVDDRTGYVAGDGSDQFPSGVFATTDGGRNWHPVPGPRTSSWRGAAFSPEGGALVGAWNRLATVRRAQVFSVEMDTLGGRTLTGVHLAGEDGVAVGQGGLVLLSARSRGSSWDYADLGLPSTVREQWDFHAVHGVGKQIWAVGRPGSVVLHSSDGGKTWDVQSTGQSLPLHGIHFQDASKGWAVGELGTILTTVDGGKSWAVARRGGQRSAVLCVHARPGSVPYDTVAQLGGDQGYLLTGVCLCAPEPASAELGRVGEGCRFTTAFRQAGGASAEMLWTFPLSSHLARADRNAVLAGWNKLHAGSATDQILGQLVQAIRMYRPDVILTDHEAAGGAEGLVAEAVQVAFRQAADPKFQPTQIDGLKLAPHQASKCYAVWSAGADAQVQMDPTRIAPRLGTSPREFSTASLAMVGQGPAPAVRHYRLLADNLPGASGHRDLMQGIALPAGGVARRTMDEGEELTEEKLKAVRQRANLWAIAEAPATELTSPERMLAQIGPALANMPMDAGARVAHGLAWQYVRRGQWTLARETFLLMVERYPAHALSVDACRWLLLHQASSEARRRHEMGQFLVVNNAKYGVTGDPQKAINLTGKEPDPKAKVQRKLGDVPSFHAENASSMAYLNTMEEVRRWYQGCLALEKKLSAFGPLYALDPATQFAVQSARRQLGDVTGAMEWYRAFAASQPAGPWKQAALAELWLSNRTGNPPCPVLTARSTEGRPYLDGKLDEACWKSAKVVTMVNATGETAKTHPTEVRITHDSDFLYVSVRCAHPVGEGTPAAEKRTRDQDLRKWERVSLLLDLDRDHATCFHLQVDARGCVAEDCWGDRSWDPRWFVAIHREETQWTLEAAIPRVALTGDHFTPGKAWSANVVRVLPGKGVQAFATPAEAPDENPRPEGMGLLMFVGEPQRAESKAGPAVAR